MAEQEDTKANKTRLMIFGGLIAIAFVTIAAVFFFSGDEKGGGDTADTQSANDAEKQIEAEFKGPTFDVVRISRGGTGVIAGRSLPNSLVEIFANDKNLGSVTADNNGDWVMILSEPLQSGSAELSLVATVEGQEPIKSAGVVVVSVPEREKEKFVESEENGVVAVLTPRDGKGPSRVMQRPGAAPVGEIGDSLTLDTIDYDSEGQAIISGRAVPRARVALYLDNRFIGAIKANDEGRWTLRPQSQISTGDHTMRIDQVIGDGDVQLRIEQPFTTGMPIDSQKRVGRVVVQPGDSLWHIARRVYGAGLRFTLIFKENDEQIRDPDLIYPGQLFDLPTQNSNGK